VIYKLVFQQLLNKIKQSNFSKNKSIMKKILTILMAVLVTNAAIAQVNFGLKAGYNSATVKSSDAEITEDGKALAGLNLGAVVNVKLKGNLSFQTGLSFGTKGVAVAHEGHADNFKFTAADIPLNLVLNTKSGLFLGTGLNLGYNLSGKLDAEDDPAENYSFKFGKGNDFFRSDFGLNFLVGYQTKSGLFFSGNSLVGLKDLKPGPETWRNNLFSISLGYMLKSSK
jgi:hypothetical protein